MCLKPITIKFIGSKWRSAGALQVPCGKCLECLKRYQNSWYVRLHAESRYYHGMVFFTLTYNDKKVPYFLDKKTGEIHRTVYKKHIQDILKRFRIRYFREYGKNADFKYFITSEYGPRTKRPHYHGVFFGITLKDFKKFFADDWHSFGFTQERYISFTDWKNVSKSLKYIVKYCSKGEFDNPKIRFKQVAPTFHLMSKKIGLRWVDSQKDRILQRGYYNHKSTGDDRLKAISDKLFYTPDNKHQYAFPRYFKIKILGEQTYLAFKVSDYVRRRNELLRVQQLEQIQADRSCTPLEALDIYTNMQLRETLHKEKTLRKQYSKYYNQSQI